MSGSISESELVEDFKRVAHELETEPTLEQYNKHGQYTQTVVYNHFDSYSALKDMVDYERSPYWIGPEDLLDDLRSVADKLGKTPIAGEYDEHGQYSIASLVKQLGTYNDALQEIGLEPNHIRNPSKEQIISEIQRLGDTEPPTAKEMSNRGKHSVPTVLTKFETWGDALETAGYERRVEYGKRISIECDICGQEFDVTPSKTDRRLCSKTCQYEFMSEAFSGQDHWNATERLEFECEQCGGSYERAPWRANESQSSFCSTDCYRDSMSVDTDTLYGDGWNKEKRKKVRQLYDRRCQGCGTAEKVCKAVTGMKLHVHHIIPARQFDSPERRNAVENLIPLCVSCHNEWEGIPLKPLIVS